MKANEINSTNLQASGDIQAVPSPKSKFSLNAGVDQVKGIRVSASIFKTISQFMNNWELSDRLFQEKLKMLSPENRSLVELQGSINRLNLQTNLAVQVGEASSNAIKRLHQMGSN